MQPGHFVPSDNMPDPSHSFWVDGVSGSSGLLGVTPPPQMLLPIEPRKTL